MEESRISAEEFDTLWALVHDMLRAERPLPTFVPTSEVNQLSNDELGDTLVKIGFVYGHYNGVVSASEKLLSGLKKMEKDASDSETIYELQALERALITVLAPATREQKVWSAYKDMFSRTVETRNDGNRHRKPGGRTPKVPGGKGIQRRE